MPPDTVPAIRAEALSKCYQLYDRPADRLRQGLWGRALGRRYYREFWALRDASFEVGRGEVLGLVGANGAGKSTLLQLVCGTLTPTGGTLDVHGRVAALLELGAGFNPEFSGRENVHLAASILGLTGAEIDVLFDPIVNFSGIRDFIDQPVKTYSSGMYMRLAFSVATSVDPDILVIDEALSVGDGDFARKSFDRIMRLKEAGKTILFCSHSLFQIESLCTRALWLHQGRIRAEGAPSRVVVAYQEFLDGLQYAANLPPGAPQQTDARPGTPSGALAETHAVTQASAPADASAAPPPDAQPGAPASDAIAAAESAVPLGHARLLGAAARVGGQPARAVKADSGVTDLILQVDYSSDPALPAPTLGVALHASDGRIISSCGSWIDGIELQRDSRGFGSASLTYSRLPLLKGNYTVSFYLLCEKSVHLYDQAQHAVTLEVAQTTMELGVVSIPHQWENAPSANTGTPHAL